MSNKGSGCGLVVREEGHRTGRSLVQGHGLVNMITGPEDGPDNGSVQVQEDGQMDTPLPV